MQLNDSASNVQFNTDSKIELLEKQFAENKEECIQLLLDKIAEVDISVPDTYKQRGTSIR